MAEDNLKGKVVVGNTSGPEEHDGWAMEVYTKIQKLEEEEEADVLELDLGEEEEVFSKKFMAVALF